MSQAGLLGMEVGGELSITDVEGYFGKTFDLRRQNDECGIGFHPTARVALVSDDNTAVTAFVVEDPLIRTDEGIGVGSTHDDVVAAYGDLVTVLEYSSQTGGPIVIVDDATRPGAEITAESRFLAFDTDEQQTVTRVRAGMWPWVGYTDYCSDDAGERVLGRTPWPLTRDGS